MLGIVSRENGGMWFWGTLVIFLGFLGSSVTTNLPAMQETGV